MILDNPLIRLFTTLLLCGMLITPFIQDMSGSDAFVRIVYFIVAIYVFLKKIYDIYRDSHNA